MAAWIESHQTLRNHRKTGRLARRLGISKVTAIGHLHCLWWWCMDNAPSGSLTGVDAEDIADGAEWEGDPAAFIEALGYAGFIEGEEVHDWYDYAGKLIEKRKADAERKRESRRRDDDPPPSNPRPRSVHRTSSGHPRDGAGTVPNRTQPNLTQPETEPHGSYLAADAARHAESAPLPAPKFPKPKDAPPLKRPPDLLFEAICEACNLDWRQLTDSERGKLNTAAAQIRKAGGTPEDVPRHATNYGLHFTTPLTPNALAGNWAKTAHAPPTRARPDSGQGGSFFSRYGHLLNGEPHDGQDEFPGALDATFTVGPAHRRQQSGGA